jgi:hypothetical protein
VSVALLWHEEPVELILDTDPEPIITEYSPLVSNHSCSRTYTFVLAAKYGFTSELNWLIFGSLYAFVTNRALQVAGEEWNYGKYSQLFDTSIFLPCNISQSRKIMAKHTEEDENVPHIYTTREWPGLSTFDPENDKKGWIDRTPYNTAKNLRMLASGLYKPSQGTLDSIAHLQQYSWVGNFSVNDTFIAVQIRTGDKALEVELSPLEDYLKCVDRISARTGIRNVFLASDSQIPIKKVHALRPTWNVGYFATSVTGHDQNKFNALPQEVRQKLTVQLMAEMDMLRRSSELVCTISSNLCVFSH